MTNTPMLDRFKIAAKQKKEKKKPAEPESFKWTSGPEEKEEPDGAVMRAAKMFGKGMGGLAAGNLAATPLAIGTFALDDRLKEQRPVGTRQIASEMGQKIDKYTHGDPGGGVGATRDGKLVTLIRTRPKDSEAIKAHEVGHVKNVEMVGKMPWGLARSGSGMLTSLSGPAAGVYSAVADDPSYTPSMVHLGLSAPILLDEALASLRALHHMTGKHGLGTGMKRSLPLLPAFGSYAAQALAPAGIVALRRFLKKREDEKKKTSGGVAEKTAKITTKLKPHQQRVVDRMEDEDQPGIVAAHGLGSGKTLTSLAVQEALGLPADIVTPAALQSNYQKEIKAHTTKHPETHIQSLEGVARTGGSGLKSPFLVVDEAHRLRNAGKARTGIKASPAKKRLALTGSLLYNHPSDVSGPINMVAGRSVLPENPDEFTQRFLQDVPMSRSLWERLRGTPAFYQTRLNPKSVGSLQAALDKYVDFHPGSTEDFPTREDATVRVPMTRDQMKLYENVGKDQPGWLRRKVLMNLPPTKAEAKQLNAFLTGVRQVANTTQGFDTSAHPAHQPKIDRAVTELQSMLAKNPRAKAIVYSHYLESGIDPYKKKLEELHIPHGSFTGEMPRAERDRMVKDYNSGKLKALLLSSAGGEGLDLKGTRLIQLLEPHWNQEKLKQVIGRGIRYKSHSGLPENERNVLVQRYLATRAPYGAMERLGLRKPGYGVDEYLDEMGARKEQLNEQVRRMLREPQST